MGDGNGQKGGGKDKEKSGSGKTSNYQAYRQRLHSQKVNRCYRDRPSTSSGSRSSGVSIQELQLRTSCHACKQIGHWSYECPQRELGPAPGHRAGRDGVSTGGGKRPAVGALFVSASSSEGHGPGTPSDSSDAWERLYQGVVCGVSAFRTLRAWSGSQCSDVSWTFFDVLGRSDKFCIGRCRRSVHIGWENSPRVPRPKSPGKMTDQSRVDGSFRRVISLS